ncbi:hypothetical protein A2U01_0053431, partial [Trifolium medium]|nr:hypothetical protein [Trifolium medium]
MRNIADVTAPQGFILLRQSKKNLFEDSRPALSFFGGRSAEPGCSGCGVGSDDNDDAEGELPECRD